MQTVSSTHIGNGVSYGWFVPAPYGGNPPEAEGIVLPQQTHTSRFGILREAGEEFPETDALVTQLKGVAVGVRTADCIPVVAYAPDIEMTAAIHAGWRGTLGGILARTFGHMIGEGASPSAIRVYFGPGICGSCYEVSSELADCFVAAGFGRAVIRPDGEAGNPHLDLVAANIIQMLKSGIPERNITRPELCTLHSWVPGSAQRLPSWRRSPGVTERLVTWIRMNDR